MTSALARKFVIIFRVFNCPTPSPKSLPWLEKWFRPPPRTSTVNHSKLIHHPTHFLILLIRYYYHPQNIDVISKWVDLCLLFHTMFEFGCHDISTLTQMLIYTCEWVDLSWFAISCMYEYRVWAHTSRGGRERGREGEKERGREGAYLYKLIIYITDYWMPSSMQY